MACNQSITILQYTSKVNEFVRVVHLDKFRSRIKGVYFFDVYCVTLITSLALTDNGAMSPSADHSYAKCSQIGTYGRNAGMICETKNWISICSGIREICVQWHCFFKNDLTFIERLWGRRITRFNVQDCSRHIIRYASIHHILLFFSQEILNQTRPLFLLTYI